ncbi:MAG: polysaccharide biosynthesis tyrosine autokinase [Ardenticatenaceae bacterium]|nr:polysaccharide biosynthesis tyrosine autokinase [Ardenticatenaceae bacterium]
MELKEYASVLWKWLWLIIVAMLIAAVSSYWASLRMQPIYQTSTTLMVGQFIQNPNPTDQDLRISQQLAQSYARLLRRQMILQTTIEALGLQMPWQALAGRVSAASAPGSQLIQINVVDGDPQRARLLADEIAHQLILHSPTTPEKEQEQYRQFVNQQLLTLQTRIEDAQKQVDELEKQLALESSARAIQDIQGQIGALQQTITTWQATYASLLDFSKGSRTNYLSVVEPAAVPTTPISPNIQRNVSLATAIAFVLAAMAALLLEYLDDTLKSDEDVDRILKLPTLGATTRIPKIQQPSDHLVTVHSPRDPITEEYRVLRTNIQFTGLSNRSTTLLITSAALGEGKTTIAANLAVIMAMAGKRVILVDGDLRRPSVHRFFGIPNRLGLTNLLVDEALALETVLMETPVAGLKIIPSGPVPPNPAELLSSERMKQRGNEMKELADVIIFDSPPALVVTDATILGTLSSGIVYVVNAGRTRSGVVRRGKETLDQVGLKILGVVLNNSTSHRARGYYYQRYYYSHESTGERRGRRLRAGAVSHRFAVNGQGTGQLKSSTTDHPTTSEDDVR